MSPDIQTIPEIEAPRSADASAPPQYSWRNWRPHPILPALTPEECDAMAGTPEGRQQLAALYKKREKLIADSEADGLRLHRAFELECWRDADQDLTDARTEGRDYGGLYVGGGKRSTKTTWAVRTALRSWLTYPGCIAWVFQRTLAISVITVQRIMWEWLPETLRSRNDVSGKRKNNDPTKIRWTDDGGFGASLVFPNHTLVNFMSYDMEPKNYQGAEIGARIRPQDFPPRWPWIHTWRPDGMALDRRGLPIPNIGALLDEDAPLAWVQTVRDRLTTRNAKFIWTFTTEKGITLAVKDTLGAAKNRETRPVDDTLPNDRVLVAGCPVGHVPYRQETATPGVKAIYFHTRFNVFGSNYENMRAQWRMRDSKQILANLFGYSEDLARRVWPLFGGWNIIDETDLPAEGTNYQIGDPGGSRNFTFIWLRIDEDGDWYIYDEWPDAQTYGEWALPDDSTEPNPNGIPGPAQRSLGWGTEQYKQMIRAKERVLIPDLGKVESENRKAQMEEALARLMPDPLRRRLVRAALEDGAEPGTFVDVSTRRRFLDPRAAGTEDIQKKGGKTIIDKFIEPELDGSGNLVSKGMRFEPAPGLEIRAGIEAVNQLLFFDKTQEIIRGLNAPRLYIVRKCRQVIWAMENFSIHRSRDESEASYEGACKDFADLPRYAATIRLKHLAAGALQTTSRGSY